MKRMRRRIEQATIVPAIMMAVGRSGLILRGRPDGGLVLLGLSWRVADGTLSGEAVVMAVVMVLSSIWFGPKTGIPYINSTFRGSDYSM